MLQNTINTLKIEIFSIFKKVMVAIDECHLILSFNEFYCIHTESDYVTVSMVTDTNPVICDAGCFDTDIYLLIVWYIGTAPKKESICTCK